jgi:hypothetical protein
MIKRFFAPRRGHLLALLAILVPLTFVGAARAEFPYMNYGPSILPHVPQEGVTLHGQTGQWLYTNGLRCNDCAYRYTWERCNAQGFACGTIEGATQYDYTLTAADVGNRVRFVEWVRKIDCDALNQNCHDIEQNGASDITALVTPPATATPKNTVVPTISGTAMEDEVLTARGGTWTGPEPITKTFQWQRCDQAGANCVSLAGATAATYKLTANDVGSRFRVVELATNAGGQSFAGSVLTTVVAELRPTATKRVIPVTKVLLPHQLLLDNFKYTRVGQRLTVRFRVSDDRGFRISGAIVGVEVVPGSGAVVERRTDGTGWAKFAYRLGQSTSTLYFYVTARKPGEKLQSGVSTSTLYRLRLR